MKRIYALLLCLVMILSLAACGNTPKQPNETPSDDAAQTVSYPLTLKDMAGREVTIEKEPQRIASGYYISTSACIALGLTDRIVAVEDKSDKRPIYSLAASQLIDLPNIGSAKAFDLETCVAAQPDLVILPMKQKDAAESLAELGIPALLVLPESHEQILEMFALIGTAANVKNAASTLSSYYTEKLVEVETLTEKLTEAERPVVYIAGTSSYLTTAPAGMYQASLITTAGGKNAGDMLEGNSWAEISYEQLLTMNPDVIVIPTNNFATSAPEYTAEDILNDEQLSELTAVKNGAVYQMPTGFEAWDSPAPSGVLGTLWMLKTLHPDLYTNEQFVQTVQDFYQTFYHFTPDVTSFK